MRTRALLVASIALILAATSPPPVSAVGTKIAEKQQFKVQLGAPEISTSIMVTNFPTPNVAFSPAIAAAANAEQNIEHAGTTLALVDKVAPNGRGTSMVQYANGPPMSQSMLKYTTVETTVFAEHNFADQLGTPPMEVAAGTTVYVDAGRAAYLRRTSSAAMLNLTATYSMMTGTYGRAGFDLART